jgi:hypothetical protein
MMTEQKGRGGKKPKYQIADIGGSDLTPQDLSTERVLNFLIKGETPAEQGADAAGIGPDHAGPPRVTAAGRGEEPADASLPSPGAHGKKSLDHLFRRASAGGPAAKDLKLNLRGQEQLAQDPHAEEVKTAEPAQPSPPSIQAEDAPDSLTPPPQLAVTKSRSAPADSQASSHGELATYPQTAATQELTSGVEATEPAENAELTQLISLWKSFYRLKDGEIEALSAMYRMSHGLGSDECYVKMHKLAEMSNLTYRYCQKVVRSLEQLGWITKLKDYNPSTQLGVLYRVNLKPSL